MSISRRTFIKHSAVLGAGLPMFNIGRAGVVASNVINHASFGSAGMAFADINRLSQDKEFKLVAVAEVDETRLGNLLERFPDVRVYKDWRKLLDKEQKHLDSVNVSTPDHMHAPIGVTAMNMGLHVYGQKPLAQTLFETRRMAEIAREKKVVTQMGTQLTSSTYERMAVQMIQDGVIGKIKRIYVFSNKTWGDPSPLPNRSDPVPEGLEWDLWCGVAEERPYLQNYYHPEEWRKRLDFGTGTLGDMGCHIYSPMFAAMSLKAPTSVKSLEGTPNKTNWAVDEKFEYTFPGNSYTASNALKVIWCDGSLRPPKRFLKMFGEKMPEQGNIFVGTDGILLAPHMELPVPYPREKYQDYRYPKIEPRDHYQDFLDAIRGSKVQPLADFHDYGGPLTETVLLGGLASRFPDEELQWDHENLRFKNSEKANSYIRRTYRKGWEVERL